jgi:hypothetical protein
MEGCPARDPRQIPGGQRQDHSACRAENTDSGTQSVTSSSRCKSKASSSFPLTSTRSDCGFWTRTACFLARCGSPRILLQEILRVMQR